MIQAVIFDMDGLLIDSEPFWQAAEKVAFRKVGIELTDAMCGQTIGLRIDEVVEHWHRQFPWDHISQKAIQELIVDHVIQFVREKGEPLSGVDRIFRFFKNKGVKIALASSSHQRLIDAVLNKFGIEECFDVIHSAEFETYGKPHPAIYLTTAQKLAVLPTECLAFEDSFNGLIAAKAARMKTICVPDPTAFDETKFDIADLKLRSLKEFNEEHLRALNN